MKSRNQNYFTCQKEYTIHYGQFPFALVRNPEYMSLSANAKLLYILLLDRTQLSLKNHYLDSQGHAYIFFSREEAARILGCGMNTATKVFHELASVDLIEEVRQRGKRANMIFVKMVVEANPNTEKIEKAREAKKVLAQKRREYLKKLNQSIREKQIKLVALTQKLSAARKEVARKPLLTIREEDMHSIRNQIDYAYFTYACPEQLPIIDQVVQSMAEMTVADSTKINGCYYPTPQLVDTLSAIDTNCILELVEHIRQSVAWGSVRHKAAYLKSLIFNFVNERELEYAAGPKPAAFS